MGKLSDLELTRLCAEAIGWKHLGAVGIELPKRGEPDPKGLWCLSGGNDWWRDPEGNAVCGPCNGIPHDYLHDDAQVMALVKYFNLDATWGPGAFKWHVGEFRFACQHGMNGKDGLFCEVVDADLNRAIVTCVARLHQAKSGG